MYVGYHIFGRNAVREDGLSYNNYTRIAFYIYFMVHDNQLL